MADLLIKNALVLTFDSGALTGRIIENGAVAVEGNLIAEIGDSAELSAKYPGAETIDAKGGIVMPGFIEIGRAHV